LSSVGTRYRQTTVGAIFATAIKEELDSVDVAVINGATIKGSATYDKSGRASMSYAELKKELPFPTKIVTVPMWRSELEEAIEYSRTCPVFDADGNPIQNTGEKPLERKGYLQTDLLYDRRAAERSKNTDRDMDDDDDEMIVVALPRNLLAGFCRIEPLMRVGERLKAEDRFPGEDDYIPAIDLVVRHFCKERWFEIVHDQFNFEDLDVERKGYLTPDDVRRVMTEAIGHAPPDFVVRDMIEAIDLDCNGVVDPYELTHLLATVEREHSLVTGGGGGSGGSGGGSSGEQLTS